MAYFPPSKIKIIALPEILQRYAWGDKNINFIRCAHCGCLSHWESFDSRPMDKMGVNARLFIKLDIQNIRIRHFDGAKTWKFLD